MDRDEPITISPTVGRRWLAQEARRLREAAGLKQSEVAKRLRCAASKIGHLETMRVPFNGPDLEVMLSFVGVPEDRIAWYLHLCDLSNSKGWWDGDGSIPEWFSMYVGLEWGATEVHAWDLGYVQGLLQTRKYADAVLRDDPSVTEDIVAEQVAVRLQRQEALSRTENPLRLHAILDESVLHRRVGDDAVMAGQLRHLVDRSRHPTITLQVMPFDSGEHRGQLGSFKWLGFPYESDPGAVYVETQTGGMFLEKPAELARFTDDFAELAKRALSEKVSRTLIERLAKEQE